MGDCILVMTKFQHPSYSIEPDAKLLKFIAEGEILGEDVGSPIPLSPYIQARILNAQKKTIWFSRNNIEDLPWLNQDSKQVRV